MRRATDLRWAGALSGRPPQIPDTPTKRAACQAGLRYERQLASALSRKLTHGQWWAYEDRNGRGWCQTDFWGRTPDGFVVIVEAKYTWTPAGHDKLEGLYRPVVAFALGMDPARVLGVQVCKRLTLSIPCGVLIRPNLEEALKAADAGNRAVWHHLGGVPQLRAPEVRAAVAA